MKTDNEVKELSINPILTPGGSIEEVKATDAQLVVHMRAVLHDVYQQAMREEPERFRNISLEQFVYLYMGQTLANMINIEDIVENALQNNLDGISVAAEIKEALSSTINTERE